MSETRKDEQKKAEEVRDPEAEYDRAWDELDSEGKEKEEETSGKELEGSEEAGKGSSEKSVESSERSSEQAREEGSEEREERISSVEKALKDTKAWATRLAQENAELKRMLEAYEKGQATRKDVEDAKKAVADAEKAFQEAQDSLDEIKNRVYEDYPELKDLLDPVINLTKSLKDELDTMKAEQRARREDDERKQALEEFNLRVKPEVMKVHPDFEDVIFKRGPEGQMALNDEYFQWAMQQRPALRYAATESSDPQDIIWAVSEFKKYKGTPEAEKLRLEQQKEKEEKIETAQSMMPSSGPAMPISKTGAASEDDYDAAWAEATKRLEKT